MNTDETEEQVTLSYAIRMVIYCAIMVILTGQLRADYDVTLVNGKNASTYVEVYPNGSGQSSAPVFMQAGDEFKYRVVGDVPAIIKIGSQTHSSAFQSGKNVTFVVSDFSNPIPYWAPKENAPQAQATEYSETFALGFFTGLAWELFGLMIAIVRKIRSGTGME